MVRRVSQAEGLEAIVMEQDAKADARKVGANVVWDHEF